MSAFYTCTHIVHVNRAYLGISYVRTFKRATLLCSQTHSKYSKLTCIHTHTCTLQIRVCMSMYTHMYIHTRNTHTHIYTHNTHVHTRTYTQIHTRAHTYAHVHTHTYTRTDVCGSVSEGCLIDLDYSVRSMRLEIVSGRTGSHSASTIVRPAGRSSFLPPFHPVPIAPSNDPTPTPRYR